MEVVNNSEVTKELLKTLLEKPDDQSTFETTSLMLSYTPGAFKNYEVISDYVYHLSDDTFDRLKTYFYETKNFDVPSFQNLRGKIDEGLSDDKVYVLDKFERHVKLACSQREFILANVRTANNIVDDIALKSDKTYKELSDTKTKIYSEFIAILGIFTAISFALMGSIQTFGTVFSKVDNPSSASMGFALIAGAVYLIIMIVLIIVLFVGMQKVLKERTEPFPWWAVNVAVFSVLFLVIIGIVLIRN